MEQTYAIFSPTGDVIQIKKYLIFLVLRKNWVQFRYFMRKDHNPNFGISIPLFSLIKKKISFHLQ